MTRMLFLASLGLYTGVSAATPKDVEDYLAAARRAYPTPAYAQYTNSIVAAYKVESTDLADRPIPGGLVRWHHVEGMRNVRDIGGWNGLPTGRAFRGSEPDCHPASDSRKSHGYAVTSNGLHTIREVMKIKTDLDLRQPKECPHPDVSALGVRLVRVPIGAYMGAFRGTNEYAAALRVFADPASYPIYFHCWGGADRTGTLAFLVEGLCGVDETDLSIDYELTTFGRNLRSRSGDGRFDFPKFVAHIKTYAGDNLSAKIASYMETTLGLSKDEIAAIRRNILGGEAVLPPSAADIEGLEELSAVRGKDWEKAGVEAHGARSGISNGILSITAPHTSRPGVYFRVPPFFSARMNRIDVRYRASGPGNGGGWLYYRVNTADFSTMGKGVHTSRFKTPALVLDGNWHAFSIGTNDLLNAADWQTAGILDAFVYEPCESVSGRVEIAEIAFKGEPLEKVVSPGNVDPAVLATLDEDVWPDVTPETWGTDDVGRPENRVKAVSVKCRGLTVEPMSAEAGSKVTLRSDYEGDMPELPMKATVRLFAENEMVWEEDLWVREGDILRYSDRFWRLQKDFVLPVCFDSRRLTVRMEASAIRCVAGHLPDAPLEYRRVHRIPGWDRPLEATVTDVGGWPRFTINGKPVAPLWGTTNWRLRADRTPRHSSAPLNFVTVWTNHMKWWPKGEELRPAELDRLAELHARAYPGAYFMWDISIYPPPDWCTAHPDEMAHDNHGLISCNWGDWMSNYSFASKEAIDLMERMIEKTIRYLEQSPYADRIAGYRINSGHGVEWSAWIPLRKADMLDFSPAAQREFEKFAKKHYPEITDFSVPTPAERQALDGDELLWDQRRHARAAAYNDFYSRVVAGDAIRLCSRAKKLVGGKKLIGTYYGYVMALGSRPWRAHYDMKGFLDAHAVDFVMSPQKYVPQRHPGQTCVDYKPFRSVAAHGIVNVIENDTRTFNTVKGQRCTQMITEKQTVAALRRDMGIALCRNEPVYTFGICGGACFDFPVFAHDASRVRRIGEHALARAAGRHAEIAYVISEDSIRDAPTSENFRPDRYDEGWQRYRVDGTVERFASTAGRPYVTEPQSLIYTRLARIGAPVDYLLAEDLADHPGDYKFYIFACCSKPTPALVNAVAKLRARRCTILWTGAPGYVSAKGKSVDAMKELTGVEFAKVQGLIDPGVKMKDGSMAGVTHNPIAPVFYVVHPDETFGVYSNGKAGLASVKTDAARTVFSGSHRLELSFLRKLAVEAGVFIFSDSTDPMEANDCLVSLHARFAGRKMIRLPRKTNVYSVFDDRVVAHDAETFSFDAPLHSSHLFYFGDDAASLME